MKRLKIVVMVGSFRKASLNQKLARALQKLAPQQLELQLYDYSDLPFYNQDDELKELPQVERFKGAIAAADGVILVTPEYNRSIPGILKNGIDHASRPYQKNLWSGKPVATIGISSGAIGTALAQQHLQAVMTALGSPVMGQPSVYLQYKSAFFTETEEIGEGSAGFLYGWLEQFADWVSRFANK